MQRERERELYVHTEGRKINSSPFHKRSWPFAKWTIIYYVTHTNATHACVCMRMCVQSTPPLPLLLSRLLRRSLFIIFFIWKGRRFVPFLCTHFSPLTQRHRDKHTHEINACTIPYCPYTVFVCMCICMHGFCRRAHPRIFISRCCNLCMCCACVCVYERILFPLPSLPQSRVF